MCKITINTILPFLFLELLINRKKKFLSDIFEFELSNKFGAIVQVVLKFMKKINIHEKFKLFDKDFLGMFCFRVLYSLELQIYTGNACARLLVQLYTRKANLSGYILFLFFSIALK